MSFPSHRGSSLVDIANGPSLLLYCVVIGDADGPPRWVQLTAHGTDTLPAYRHTVVRAEGESCEALWKRVLSSIRDLKRPRGLQHGVLVDCRIDAPPRHPDQVDSRFNLTRALWHEVDRERDSAKRALALRTLADISAYSGKLQ